MLTIQFKDASLCEAYYNQLMKSLNTYDGVDDEIYLENSGRYTNLCIQLSTIHEVSTDRKSAVASVLTNVTINKFLPIWLEEWLREGFHYKDSYEIDAIIVQAKDIFLNYKRGIPLKFSFHSWQKDIYHLFHLFIQESVQFSFDSFLRFRLRDTREKLVEVVERAIDEYKLEHNYQVMLDTCRRHLQSHPPKIDTVYLFIDKEISIVNPGGDVISPQQLRRWLTNDLSFEAPLPIGERVIGPLVSIAPSRLIVYPKYDYEGLIQTLMSIFEERLIIREDKKPVQLN